MRPILLVVWCASLFFTFAAGANAQGHKDAFGDPLPAGAIARIGTLRYRLPDIHALPALSPDGKLLAAVGQGDDIEIWELPAWKRQRVISNSSIDKNHPQIPSLAFSADSKLLAACDVNQMQIHLLDVAAGKTFKKIRLPDKTSFQDPVIRMSSDQKTLVCTYLDERNKGFAMQVVVWDLANDKLRKTITIPLDRSNGNQAIGVVSDDARWLVHNVAKANNRANQGADYFIEFWDLTLGKAVSRIETEVPFLRLALSADGKWLAASNNSTLLRIYEAATGKEMHNIRGRSPIQHLQFALDGALYVADFDNQIHRWDVARGERGASWKAPVRNDVFGPGMLRLVFPPRGKMLALRTDAVAVHFWEVETGKLFSPTALPMDTISEVAFSPQGELFAASDDGILAWWNPRTGAKLRDLKLHLSGNESQRYIVVDVSPNFPRGAGRNGVVTMSSSAEFLVSSDGNAYFDAKTGKVLYDVTSNAASGANMCFLDGGAKSASVHNKKVRVWSTRTGRDISSFEFPVRDQEQTTFLAASVQGDYFAVQTANRQGEVAGRGLLWDAKKKKIVHEWTSQSGGDAMQFSLDQQWLASASQGHGGVRLTRIGPAAFSDYDLAPVAKDANVTALLFSPDSRQLACADNIPPTSDGYGAGVIHIHEIYSKKIRLDLAGHRSGSIERLAYSPDGALLASGATDTTALVWNASLQAFAAAPLAKDATAAELDAWYVQMAGADARAAFQHMIKLTRARDQAVTLLEKKIRPAKKPDSGAKTIKQWIGDLGSGQFTTRTKANATLQKIGPAAEPALREALKTVTDIETRRRVEELLERIARREWTAEEVLHARAVEVLEAIGTPAARVALTRWTTGDPVAILTVEARKAVERAARKE